MNPKTKVITKVCAAVALAMSGAVANADQLLFDLDGDQTTLNGGTTSADAVTIDTWDFSPGNIVADDGVRAIENFVAISTATQIENFLGQYTIDTNQDGVYQATEMDAWNSTNQNPDLNLTYTDLNSDGNIATADTQFTVYGMATLANTSLSGSTNNSDALTAQTAMQTVVFGYTEQVVSLTSATQEIIYYDDDGDPNTPDAELVISKSTANFQLVNDGNSFFEYWVGTNQDGFLGYDNLTGEGFNDGTLILAGDITKATGDFGITDATTSGQVLVLDPETGLPADDDNDPTNGIQLVYADNPLDQFEDNDYPNTLTVDGAGSTSTFNVLVDNSTIDGAYFPDLVDGDIISLIFTLSGLNVGQDVPYESVDPAACFVMAAGGTGNSSCDGTFMNADATGFNPEVGAVNGFSGDDFLAQTDYNVVPQLIIERVPEPSVLGLLGLSLSMLGFVGYRRRQA